MTYEHSHPNWTFSITLWHWNVISTNTDNRCRITPSDFIPPAHFIFYPIDSKVHAFSLSNEMSRLVQSPFCHLETSTMQVVVKVSDCGLSKQIGARLLNRDWKFWTRYMDRSQFLIKIASWNRKADRKKFFCIAAFKLDTKCEKRVSWKHIQ